MIYAAILGYGTVGSGVLEVFSTNAAIINEKAGEEIKIKYVLDIRDFKGDPVENILVHDYDVILNDDEVHIIAEVMGGVEPAFTFVKKALKKGKSVVTSNKELVALHGAELLKTARENNCNFLFEASVGGGIPVIRPLNQSLTADDIIEISGILNGTTNYILTKMTQEDRDYDEVLKAAQEKGYAEKNPAADVEGYDSCRKIAILTSMATGMHTDYNDIYTEGITKITKTDIEYVKKLNLSVKLLATAKKTANGVRAAVYPAIIDNDNPLSMVNNVFNAVLIKGNMTGDVMFYGKGAGKLPTASAVAADIIDAVKHFNRNIMTAWTDKRLEIIDINSIKLSKLVRVGFEDRNNTIAAVKELFGDIELIELQNAQNEFAFITPAETEKVINEKLSRLNDREKIKVINSIRFESR